MDSSPLRNLLEKAKDEGERRDLRSPSSSSSWSPSSPSSSCSASSPSSTSWYSGEEQGKAKRPNRQDGGSLQRLWQWQGRRWRGRQRQGGQCHRLTVKLGFVRRISSCFNRMVVSLCVVSAGWFCDEARVSEKHIKADWWAGLSHIFIPSKCSVLVFWGLIISLICIHFRSPVQFLFSGEHHVWPAGHGRGWKAEQGGVRQADGQDKKVKKNICGTSWSPRQKSTTKV